MIEPLKRHHQLNREQVISRVEREGWRRITVDFDGSVLSTKEATPKGLPSGLISRRRERAAYYPLYCTLAQSGQVFDVLHRSGNVHDSKGAVAFVRQCIDRIREFLPGVIIEIRMDSAFFSDEMVTLLEALGAEFTIFGALRAICAIKAAGAGAEGVVAGTAEGKLRFFQKE